MSKEKINDALQRYYKAFDYDAGTLAYKRGGQMGFGNRYDLGSWFNKVASISKDQAKTAKATSDSSSSFSFGDANWGGLVGAATGLLGDTVSGFQDMSDRYNQYVDSINTYGAGAFSNIYDNDALLTAINNTSKLSGIEKEDIRDKSVLQDVGSALSTGLNAGLSTGNVWVGLGAMALDAGKSIAQRFQAKSYADRVNQYIKDKNIRLDKQAFMAGQGVDAHNDWMRMMSYYNNPFEYAYGGEMHSHGATFDNGLTFINEGGTHEQNPLEGVPSGVDENGVPNLVEEGEVIWNNEYVFSDRIKIPKRLAEKYKLDEGLTFADAIKAATKESLIRPNDPISNDTNRDIVNEFMDEQEFLREKEQQRAARQVQQAIDEDFASQLESIQGGGQAPVGPVDMGVQMPMQEGMPVEGMPPGFALGGHKFLPGGSKDNDLISMGVNAQGQTVYIVGSTEFPSYAAAQEAVAKMSPEQLAFVLDKSRPHTSKSTVAPAVITGTVRKETPAQQTKTQRLPVDADYKVEPYVDGHYPNGKPIIKYKVGNRKGFISEKDALKAIDEAKVANATTARQVPGYNSKVYVLSDGTIVGTKEEARKAQKAHNKTLREGKSFVTDTTSTKTTKAQMPVESTPQVDTTAVQNSLENVFAAQDLVPPAPTAPASEQVNPPTKPVKKTTRVSTSSSDRPASNTPTKSNEPAPRVAGVAVSPAGTIRIPNTSADVEANLLELQKYLPAVESEGLAGGLTYRPKGFNPNTTVPPRKTPQYEGTDWARMAPIYGAGAMALNDIIQGPQYYNADKIIEAARLAGAPVNIPVQTIGDYMSYVPFDTRYLVNKANQNRAAATRGIVNTSAGNRAMDLLGNMALAHSSQYELGEIARQAYLANQQQRAAVAEFNRGTNLQNMSAINQRNLSQAQLNSQRQQAMLNGLMQGYGLRQGIWKDWRDDRDANLETLFDNLHAYSRDQFGYNQTQGLINNGYFNWGTDNQGNIWFNPTVVAKGGVKKNKKRRF